MSDNFRITVIHKPCGAMFEMEAIDGNVTLAISYRITQRRPTIPLNAGGAGRAFPVNIGQADGSELTVEYGTANVTSPTTAKWEAASRPEPLEWTCTGRAGRSCNTKVLLTWGEIDEHHDHLKTLRVE